MGTGENPPGIVGRLAQPGLFWRACSIDSRGARRSAYNATPSFYWAGSPDGRADDVAGALDSYVKDTRQHPRRLTGDWATYARGSRRSLRSEQGGAGGLARAGSD